MCLPARDLTVRVRDEIVDGLYTGGDGVSIEGALDGGQATEGQKVDKGVHAYVRVKEDVQLFRGNGSAGQKEGFGQQGDPVRVLLEECAYLIFLTRKKEQAHVEKVPVDIGDDSPHVVS